MFRGNDWIHEPLREALLDPDGEVREAGSEVLFALAPEHDYDPSAPEAERLEIVYRIFQAGLPPA